MARRYWLMKCEPAAYTIDDLQRDGQTSWEGVRNYQARNFMRDDMRVGDGVLFYASNAKPSGVTGIAKVSRTAYPDHFAWEEGHRYFDARSTRAKPLWYMVDIEFVERFADTIPLARLKSTKGLEDMMVTKPGSRLSVQPLTRAQFDVVRRLGKKSGADAPGAEEATRKAAPARKAAPTRKVAPARKAAPAAEAAPKPRRRPPAGALAAAAIGAGALALSLLSAGQVSGPGAPAPTAVAETAPPAAASAAAAPAPAGAAGAPAAADAPSAPIADASPAATDTPAAAAARPAPAPAPPALAAAAPAAAADAEAWAAPQTPWGDPDLQGIWSSGYILTPLERPDAFEGREFVTDDERAELEAAAFARLDHSVGGPRRGGGQGTGTYNSAFTGAGREVISTGRTSQIVDPPDGRIPWTDEAREQVAAETVVNSSERGRFLAEDNELGGDGPEDRPNDRCLGVSIPLRFAAAGSSATLHRIVQSPEQVSIYYEHGHQGGAYRQVPLDGRPHLPPGIRQFLGDARGRWEGDTLVIETTNFTDRTSYEGARGNLRLVERFTPVGADSVVYRATIEDATVFTQPWTIEIPLTRQDDRANQIYESACHEGNYALTSILMGARLLDGR